MDDLKSVLLRVIKEHLSPANVLSVDVVADNDHDGDPILRVVIVFEVEGDRLDPRQIKSLGRHLREPLEKINEERFPVFSFKTLSEQSSEAA